MYRERLSGAVVWPSTRRVTVCIFAVGVLVSILSFASQEARSAEELFYAGEYAECLAKAKAEVDRGVWNERWPTLLAKSQMTLGRYTDALLTIDKALQRYRSSLSLHLLAADVYRANGLEEKATEIIQQMIRRIESNPRQFSSRANQIAIGRLALSQGEDARQILELFYDRVLKFDASFVDAHLATAELALEKYDYKIAADALGKAIKLRGDDPDLHQLSAVAWRTSDGEKSMAALAKALELNPRHIPSLLLRADRLIDAEQYDKAKEVLSEVLAVNPNEPQAWAYHAIIAHLLGQYEPEKQLREVALTAWPRSPRVDYLIGKKLAAKYRFEVAKSYLRRSLAIDSQFMPARFELAQCLLRLGEEEEGWLLANAVHKEDGYNVVAHNLVSLSDKLSKYATLTRGDIIVRMEARESRIYGDAVVDLLSEARATLCDKYDMQPDKPIIVEIFPKQQDFAIRTFGVPGGDGFLGVCFGRVITANSPASRVTSPSNWKAVLWHEFCHVVTLEKTNNRMPRWLSEGISVYEERQRNPIWGEQMTAEYRRMILGDDLTPVSELSGAFLSPKSPLHLQFAYYESSLVVEYIIEKMGFDTLKRILEDMSVGMPINDSLARYAGSLGSLDAEFKKYVRERAKHVGLEETDWSRDELPEGRDVDWDAWSRDHPKNFWGLRANAAQLIQKQSWQKAKAVLEELHRLYPEDPSSNSALRTLARIHRQLEDTEAEYETLEKIVALDCDAADAAIRLMEIEVDRDDWQSVAEHADYLLALNPLLPIGHQMASKAYAKVDPARAIPSLKALVEMNPTDPAELHFRTAKTLSELGRRDDAKRQVLMALEEAPRYREAQRLLLKLVEPNDPVEAAEGENPSEVETSAEQEDSTEQLATENGVAETEPTEIEPSLEVDSAGSQEEDSNANR